MGHRRFLPIRHKFRNDVNSFNGKCENDLAPNPLTGMECLRQLSNLKFTFGKTPTTEHIIGQKKRRTSNATRESRVTGQKKRRTSYFYPSDIELLYLIGNIF